MVIWHFSEFACVAHIKQDTRPATNNALCQKEAMRNSRRSQASTSRFITPSTILQRTDNEKMVLTDPLSAHQGPLPTLLIRPLAYSEEAKPLLAVCFWDNSGETPGLKPIIHLRSHYDLLSSTVVHSIMHILPTEPLDLVNFLKSMIAANLL